MTQISSLGEVPLSGHPEGPEPLRWPPEPVLECGGKVGDLSFTTNPNIGVKWRLPENPRGGCLSSAMDGIDREGRRIGPAFPGPQSRDEARTR